MNNEANIVYLRRIRSVFLLVLFLIGGTLLLGSACSHPGGTPSDRASQPETVKENVPEGAHPERVGVTIFLRHQQSKSLEEILATLTSRQFYRRFPPEGVEVVRWDVVMGIGQIVTVLVRPGHIRSVNTVIEKRAWGSFDTEFYPTYIPADAETPTDSRTEGITNEDDVLMTVIVEHTAERDRSGSTQPDISNLPDRIEVEMIRRLLGRGTLYTFRVPPDRVAALDRTLDRWVQSPGDLEAYTTYNFLPIHRKITGTSEDD